jgi:hypothetical protein
MGAARRQSTPWSRAYRMAATIAGLLIGLAATALMTVYRSPSTDALIMMALAKMLARTLGLAARAATVRPTPVALATN